MGPASPAKRMDTWLGPLGLSPSRLIIAARTLAYCTEYMDYTPPVVVPCQAHQTPHRATHSQQSPRESVRRDGGIGRERREFLFFSLTWFVPLEATIRDPIVRLPPDFFELEVILNGLHSPKELMHS